MVIIAYTRYVESKMNYESVVYVDNQKIRHILSDSEDILIRCSIFSDQVDLKTSKRVSVR